MRTIFGYANYILFTLAGILAVLGFFTAISEGETVMFSLGIGAGMFTGLVGAAYLALVAGIVISVCAIWILSKILVLFLLASIVGVVGGIMKILGG